MKERFARHFEDTQICHSPKEKDVLSLFRLLVSTATQGKSENIPPKLGGELMRSILEGIPYPQSLLSAAISRAKAEQARKDVKTGRALPNVPYPRAAIIKACINRQTKYRKPEIKEELKVSLDPENKNIGYLLGRLFAVLEKIQQETHLGINATIRDKFYGAASGSPVTVFPNLMRLKNHHLAKLENPRRRIYFERLLAEILSGVNDFPGHLAIGDQGRFAIGYYHQMQDFYPKKEKSE